MTACCGMQQPDLREHVHPVLVGQRQVEQNHVKSALPNLRQTFPSRSRDDDGVALELKQSLQRLPDFRFIVNDEDSARALRRAFAAAASARDDCYFRHCYFRHGLPSWSINQWKIQGEGGAFARAALHADIARVFLDDAVGDRKSKTGAAILAFGGRRLGGEKWIVDAVNVFLRNARAGVGDAHADEFAVQRRHVQYSAPGHRVLGVQEQIQKHLLQASGVALNQRQVLEKFVVAPGCEPP